jgi:hypothetical protein
MMPPDRPWAPGQELEHEERTRISFDVRKFPVTAATRLSAPDSSIGSMERQGNVPRPSNRRRYI